jgi:hypothetical protein
LPRYRGLVTQILLHLPIPQELAKEYLSDS